MTVGEIAKKLEFKTYVNEEVLDTNVNGCYIGDLLSLAMSRIQRGNLWITIQTNVNVVAVASLTEAACVVIADGCVPESNTIERANQQNITIFGSELSAYEIAVRLSEMGI